MMKRMKEGVFALVMALVVIAGQSPEVQAQDQTGGGIPSLESGDGITFESPADDDNPLTASNAKAATAVAAQNHDTPGLTIDPSSGFTVRENSSLSFTVMLDTQPSGNVRVIMGNLPDNDVSVSPPSLDFTPSNWNSAQSVTVRVANDHDSIDERMTLSIVATGSDYGDVRGSLLIEVEDDDDPRLAVTPSTIFLDEGRSGSFAVRLATEPTGTVTVAVSQPSNRDIRISPDALIFTPSTWNVFKTVNIQTVTDNDSSNDTGNVVLTASGGGYGGQSETVPVTVVDNGGPSQPSPSDYAILVSDPSITVDEGGNSRFEVRLKTRPSRNVTVNLILPDHSDITLTSDTLIFTPSNWGTLQPVEMSVGEDADFANDLVRIDLTARGGGYDNALAKVEVSVIDNDTFGSALVLSSKELTLNEGESGTFTVRLSVRPGAEVDVVLSQPSNSDIKIDTDDTRPGYQIALQFTSQNWNIPQSVGVFTAHDNDAVDERGSVSMTASGGGYTRVVNDLTVSVIDDDPPADFILFPSPDLTVSEGGSAIFTLRLATRPSGEVRLTLIQPTNVDIRVDTDPEMEGFQNKLVFGLSNWGQGQVVLVSAAYDRDRSDNRTGVSIVATGAEEYSGKTTQLTVISVESASSVGWETRSAIPALAPPSAQDMTTIRVSCKDDSVPCNVFLDCTAQDGTIYRGSMRPIPASGARVLNTRNIVDIVGGDWSGKGRLHCALKSLELVSGQIWTRSGDAVLVNNTQSLRSDEVIDASGRIYQRVDIESIPSPDDSDLSNIRIRCEGENDCTDVVFECYNDDGTLYSGVLGFLGRTHTRHLQTRDLSSMIGYRWQGMTLACEVRSDHPFSVQVLTRTGGGGALVNNSATSFYPENEWLRR